MKPAATVAEKIVQRLEEFVASLQPKAGRGFAAMDPEQQRRIASAGGKAAHAKGVAHRFSVQEAREAGKKGGKRAHELGTAFEFRTSEEAAAAGRKGGQSRGRRQTNIIVEMPEPAPLPEPVSVTKITGPGDIIRNTGEATHG